MKHYRIIAVIWHLFGVIGLALSLKEFLRCLEMGDSLTDGSTVSTFIGFGFCFLAAATSFGLFIAKGWARITISLIAISLGLYCLSVLVMIGLRFGALTYVACWLGIALVASTLTVTLSLKPHKR